MRRHIVHHANKYPNELENALGDTSSQAALHVFVKNLAVLQLENRLRNGAGAGQHYFGKFLKIKRQMQRK